MSIGGVPVITGSPTQIDGGYDSFIASIQPDGIVTWTMGVGGDGNNYDYIQDVTTDSKDNVIITGYSNSPTVYFGEISIQSNLISENYVSMTVLRNSGLSPYLSPAMPTYFL